jgi:beta-glucosidase
VSALFPFGFGLSYTTFKLENARLSKSKIRSTGKTEAVVDVTNTGKRAGSEVVQMYIRDRISSVTRPIKELKGFKKVWLKPGETQTVKLGIDQESLAFYDVNMEYSIEPGEFEILIGTSSRTADLTPLVLTVTR